MILCLFTPRLPEGFAAKLLELVGTLSERVWQDGSFLYLQVPACDGQLLVDLQRRACRLIRRPVGVGAASGPTLACMAAKIALGKEPILVPKGSETMFLAPIPLHTVIGDHRALRRLNLLGISTLGDLASADPTMVAAHLGRRARHLIKLARGEETSSPPLAPTEAEVHSKVDFQDPPMDLQALLSSLARPLGVAAAELCSKGMKPSRLELELHFKKAPPRHVLLRLTTYDLQTMLERVATLLLGMDFSSRVFSASFALSGKASPEEQRPLLPLEGDGQSSDQPIQELQGQEPDTTIEVRTDRRGLPATFTLRGRTYRIVEMLDRWRIDSGWWDERKARDFFKVLASDGSVWTLSRDLLRRGWRIERLYD
jgi:nucleotidyltransferase/DNA polymerase involved in DNA repair